MIKHFLLFAGLLFSLQVIAQTGIGTVSPHPSAKLEVNATDKGFLPPRVTLSSVTDATTIPTPATGLLVYNLGSVGLKAGYYYWNGSNWATIATASSPDQTLDYVSVQSSGQTVVTGNTIMYNTTLSGNIPYNSSTGNFTLIAGKTYRLTAYATLDVSSSAGAELNFVWRNSANAELGNYALLLAANSTITAAGQGIVDVIYTPTTNTTVSVYVNWAGGTVALRGGYTYATIQQIGSSATINPWILSGTTTYNTTGNVGIGNSAPATKLDVTGSLGVSGSTTFRTAGGDEGGEIEFGVPQTNTTLSTRVVQDIWQNRLRFFDGNTNGVHVDLSKAPIGVGGELLWKKTGFVNAGDFVTLDNVKATVTTSGSRGLSIGAVSTSFVADVSGNYGASIGGAGSSRNEQTYTTTSSTSLFGWSLGAHGDSATYILYDKTNNRVYRITMMIGPSYINNFISIERLF